MEILVVKGWFPFGALNGLFSGAKIAFSYRE